MNDYKAVARFGGKTNGIFDEVACVHVEDCFIGERVRATDFVKAVFKLGDYVGHKFVLRDSS